MFIRNYFFFIFIFIFLVILFFFQKDQKDQNKNQNNIKKDLLLLDLKKPIDPSLYKKRNVYYKKRYWCPSQKEFFYTQKILSDNLKQEEGFDNYYKLVYLSNKEQKEFLYLESSYKNKDYPVGNWNYYNAKKQVLEKQSYKKGKLKSRDVYLYDEMSYKKAEYHYVYDAFNKESIKSYSFYFYNLLDKKKKSLGKHEYYQDGILHETILYEYDKNNGFLKKKSFYELNFQLKNYKIYQYANDLRIKESTYDRDNKKSFYKKYIYDKKGTLVNKKEYVKKEKDQFFLFRDYWYLYDKQNFLIKEVLKERSFKDKKESLKKIYEIQYKNNNEGCVLEEKRFNSNNILIEHIKY